MRLILSVVITLLCLGGSASFGSPGITGADLDATFSVETSTKVPGKVLKKGTYSIRIVDQLSDRLIIEIKSGDGKKQTTFVGLRNTKLGNGGAVGPISWPGEKKSSNAMRGFAFPGGGTIEFVYPKSEAVEIAKTTSEQIVAIDPASEGHSNAKNLSRDDYQLLTLWTMSATRVGPPKDSQPAIEASRYQQPTVPVDTAQVAQSRVPQPSIRVQASSPNRQLASMKRTPVISTLPHTASPAPLVLLMGILLLLGAGMLRVVRRVMSAA